MEYITVKEAAQRWGISLRTAQQYCVDGRIEGATKFSGSWAIPSDSPKPSDARKKSVERQEDLSGESGAEDKNEEDEPVSILERMNMSLPMPLLNTPFKPGAARAAAESIENEDLRNIALGEYYYFSGQSEKAAAAVEPYLECEDIGLSLSACWIYAYANLTLDRINSARKAISNVKMVLGRVDGNTPRELRILSVFISSAASILLHLPVEHEMPAMKDFIATLPPGLRLFALYVQAHYAYLKGEYGASAGVAETALALEEEIYPIPTIYLHMIATMDYMSMKQPERAREHMLAAWEIARPDDLIEAFGEHHGLLGGMLEAVIKKDWPQDFKRIINIVYKFSAGWRKIHNVDTGHYVADNLTTTEFVVAMLASRSWTNKEIAAHLGISVNTVNNYVAVALQKLNLSQRKELKKFLLL